MMIIIFYIALNVIIISGSSLSDQVHQIQSDIYAKSGEAVEIQCVHSIANYDRIMWYRQTEDGQLHYLGYMVSTLGYPSSGLQIKGNAAANQTCTLRIDKVALNSSAVYFCAASYHSTTLSLLISTITSSSSTEQPTASDTWTYICQILVCL
ncbi:uncharacterized protein LOC119474477 [Xyrichtys novacula]|uniref:Uncharacterized protein LOC119474477 n=1 Tax=Xyrichtys novacula TaxID=13765 RepID=A0AAV1GNT4_XYRNO|nr:uncharacterized protein LOC119474477 [Xyrichtys novacula]